MLRSNALQLMMNLCEENKLAKVPFKLSFDLGEVTGKLLRVTRSKV